jgi:DNA-binding response OmpR family regulator
MGKRILLVDDDPAVRDSVAMVLEGAGFVVDQADQGATALRLLRAQAPDLVITDILMPQKEGIETIREIRLILPNTPIIAISGVADAGANYLKMAQSLGATTIMAKPFDPRAMLKLVSELLGCGASAAPQ